MSEEEQEKRELATSRLLDLLRAQQAGEKEGPEPEPPPEAGEERVSAAPAEEEPAESTLAEGAAVTPETETVVSTGVEKKPEGPADTAPVAAEVQESVPTGGAEGREAPAPPPGAGMKDLLGEIQSTEKPGEPEREVEIEPAEFDGTLFSTLSKQPRKGDLLDTAVTVFHFLNESQRRITIHFGKNILRLMQVQIGIKKVTIEKFGEYSLPYESDGETITEMSDLLTYVLDKEITPKHKRLAFGACYSSDNQLNTKTHILQAPPLKGKELNDLVEWNAKKNLPFSPEQAVLDWETTPTIREAAKQNVVIAIGEKDPIENIAALFQENKLTLRCFSTLPVLLWKLFKRNYPDRKAGAYVVIHIGEKRTTVEAIVEQKLLFNREIQVGVEDFYKAIMQKIVTGDRTIEIDYPLAKRLLRDYGVPVKTNGVAAGLGINLYKLSIFLRPAVERLTSELNRSLNYFKKQDPELEWEELLFSGIGATFPNFVQTIGQNLNFKVGLLNPVRQENFQYQDGAVLPERDLPNYSVNFALALDEAQQMNIIPPTRRSGFKYILLNKLALLAALILIPLFTTTLMTTNQRISDLRQQIDTKNEQWTLLSSEAREYTARFDDINILDGYRKFLRNDQTYSVNQVRILKALSAVVPSDIKLTSLNFKGEVAPREEGGTVTEQVNRNLLEVRGFVQAHASVADIHFTNFIMGLENLPLFSRVEPNLEEHSNPEEGKLFFTLNLRF